MILTIQINRGSGVQISLQAFLKMPDVLDVVAAIIEREGKFLIGRRIRGELKGKWEFPGGKLKNNETCKECLMRELYEEFRVKVEVGKRLGENVHDYGWVEIRLIGYYAKHVSGEFRLIDHDQIEWVPPHEFKNYDFAAADIPLVQIVADNYS